MTDVEGQSRVQGMRWVCDSSFVFGHTAKKACRTTQPESLLPIFLVSHAPFLTLTCFVWCFLEFHATHEDALMFGSSAQCVLQIQKITTTYRWFSFVVAERDGDG